MNPYLNLVTILACGLMAGVFLTFSSFVMKALAELPAAFFGNPWGGGGTVTALRSVLMKPEHLSAVGTLYALLDRSAH